MSLECRDGVPGPNGLHAVCLAEKEGKSGGDIAW